MKKLLAALMIIAGPVAADPLPSWNDTAAKGTIIDFVEAVTDPASADFVPEADRIATFDNDGTLWSEQPAYFQVFFALDRLKQMAGADPSVLSDDVLKAAAEGDMKTVEASGKEGLTEIINATHSGLSVDDFLEAVGDWAATATHPTTGMAYPDMTFQPMLELLSYLRDEGFTTYIVSGGGTDFIRAFSESAYNIPVSQVIGSYGKYTFQQGDGGTAVMKAPGIFFIDDKEGKPVGIQTRIGKRPILAAGNSDGDYQMLEFTTLGEGRRLGLLVHHTDAAREFAYDRDSTFGKLDKGLDDAGKQGWLVVDMAQDWSRVWSGGEPAKK